MEDVAELVEQRDDLVVQQQRRPVTGRLREVGHDRRHRGAVRTVGEPASRDEVERRGMAELALARVQVHVDDGDVRPCGPVDDREAADVGVPHGHVDRAVLEPEDLAGDLEHPVEHLLQREVGRDGVQVDAVLGLAQRGVVVAPVPQLEVVVADIRGEAGGHDGDLLRRLLAQRRDEALVERVDGLGVVGHLLVHRVVRPRWPAEQLGDPLPQRDGLGEEGRVGVGGAVVEQARQLLAALAVGGVLQERDDVGVRHRDPVAPVVVTGERLAVLVGEAVEVGLVDEQDVVDLGDVLVEAHADLDEASHRGPDLLAGLRRQVVAGEAHVALGERQQAGELTGQGRRLGRRAELVDGRRHLRVEGEVDGPALEALVGLMGGGTDGGIGMHVGHEPGAAHRLGDHAPGPVEREQRRRDGAWLPGAVAAVTIAAASCSACSVAAVMVSGVAAAKSNGTPPTLPKPTRDASRFPIHSRFVAPRATNRAVNARSGGESSSRSEPSEQPLADGVDAEAGDAADDGAVDADELEVVADLQLDAS